MALPDAARAMAGLAVVVVSLAGCVAPDEEVIGALGVSVDEAHRPVIVVEACSGAATEVDLFFDREGLSDDEESEQVAAWHSSKSVAGTSELVLPAPGDPWQGQPVEVADDRGYVATAVGEGDHEVLSQVAFRASDLIDMRPRRVYVNHTDPDVRELVGRSAGEFTAEVCEGG